MSVSETNPTVLIAPLDWGLGHVTRCIPLIQYFLKKNFQVIVACNTNQRNVLQSEFPNLEYLDLNGYNISYSKEKRFLPVKILMQLPKILRAVYKEFNWLKRLLKQREIDLIISDNRYGFYSKKVFSVFITHQLLIKANNKFTERLMQQINYRFIHRFNECWVPDVDDEKNISGQLAHPLQMPQTVVKYIGPLSRFKALQPVEKKYDFIVILSGPEPQLTILEEKMKKAVAQINASFIMLRGVASGKHSIEQVSDNLLIADHLPTDQLNKVIAESEFIISRCGYTTVMELLSLQKKSILIPTPGQTEQEYLAKHLLQQRWGYTFQQHEDFVNNIKSATQFNYQFPQFSYNVFEEVIDEAIKKIRYFSDSQTAQTNA